MPIEKLKLYHFPATRSARVKWLLHELFGDGFELERISLFERGQHDADFLRINPNHCVPALEMTLPDGQTLNMIESGAMVEMLADAFPEKRLAPPPAFSPERVDYLQILHFGATWMDMMLWQIRIHEELLPEAERDERTVARYRRKFAAEVEPQLLARLEPGGFITGGGFSAADCVICHNVMWARAYDLCGDDVFAAYVARLSERPAFVRTFSDIGDMAGVPDWGRAFFGKFGARGGAA